MSNELAVFQKLSVPLGAYQDLAEFAPYQQRGNQIQELFWRASLATPKLSMQQVYDVCDVGRAAIQNLFDVYQSRLQNLLGKVDERLTKMGDATEKAALAEEARNFCVANNEGAILLQIERALAERSMNYAFELLYYAKRSRKISGFEHNVETKLYAILGIPEIGDGIRNWEEYGRAITRWQDFAVNSLLRRNQGMWENLINLMCDVSQKDTARYNRVAAQYAGQRFETALNR